MRWSLSCLTVNGSDLSYLFTVLDECISVKEKPCRANWKQSSEVHSYLSYVQATVLLSSFWYWADGGWQVVLMQVITQHIKWDLNKGLSDWEYNVCIVHLLQIFTPYSTHKWQGHHFWFILYWVFNWSLFPPFFF